MTRVSPLLNSYIQPNKQQIEQNHERIYEDLQKRANEVKPNEAKAKLVKRGPVTDAVNSIKDTGKDCVNFVKAVKTGKLSDNNLGRLNDLGLKAGALLIASYLALHAKTKTEKIMSFVGGGTFLAAMSLWPKLFINLPARLVHGFNIDQKYINAQGDKKDFFLDNQFIPWDAYSKEELEKIGKRTGIDYNSENGEEKIKRKMQKTALQNRTLWMATAGFATPLMTAMVGNFVEPYIEKAVIKNGFDRANAALKDQNSLESFLRGAKPLSINTQEIETLLAPAKDQAGAIARGPRSKDFFAQLADRLKITEVFRAFDDKDDARIIETFKPTGIAAELETRYAQLAKVAPDSQGSLRSAIEAATKVKKGGGLRLVGGAKVSAGTVDVENIMRAIGDNYSLAHIRAQLKKAGLDAEAVFKDLNIDDTAFVDEIKKFSKEDLPKLLGRFKSFLGLANAIGGSKAESMATQEITETMMTYMKKFGFDYSQLEQIKKGDQAAVQEFLVKFYKALATKAGKPLDDEAYKGVLETIFRQENKALTDAIDGIHSKDHIDTIFGKTRTPLLEAMLGGKKDATVTLEGALANFAELKKTDINAFRLKGLLCANVERRIKTLAKECGVDEGVIRKFAYDPNLSFLFNNGNLPDRKTVERIIERMFNPEQFKIEKGMDSQLETFLRKIKEQALTVVDKRYHGDSKTVTGFSEGTFGFVNFNKRVKDAATRLYNNKTWMKKFGIMFAVLAGVTLAVQPLFGKIKKEYPEKKQGGAK